MTDSLDFSDGNHTEFSAWHNENHLFVAVYDDYGSSMPLTRVQALRLAEYIGEVFGD